MSEKEKTEKAKKPKLCWMVIASPILILVGVIIGLGLNRPVHIPVTLGIWIFVLWISGALSLSVIGYYRIHKNQGRLSGKLCAVLGTALALFIVIGLLMPERSYAPPKQRWLTGRVMAGSVATAIRVYAEEKGPDAEPPSDNDFDAIGFSAEVLASGYCNQGKDNTLSFTVESLYPLKFKITLVNKNFQGRMMTLDQDGVWTEKNE